MSVRITSEQPGNVFPMLSQGKPVPVAVPPDGGPTLTLSATFDATLEALLALAAQVITEHTSDEGSCTVCGVAFPCERAVLAEHNLALL